MELPQRAKPEAFKTPQERVTPISAIEMIGAVYYHLSNRFLPNYGSTFDLEGKVTRTSNGYEFIIYSNSFPTTYTGNFQIDPIDREDRDFTPEQYRDNITEELINGLTMRGYSPSLILKQNPLEFVIRIPRPKHPLANPARPQTMTPIKETPKS